MLDSFYRRLCEVKFPEYQARQHYMHEFNPLKPTMPKGLEDYIPMISFLAWQVDVTDPIFVTIDEKIIQPGMSQRRPGPHVDGCFMKAEPTITYERGYGPGDGDSHILDDLDERMKRAMAAMTGQPYDGPLPPLGYWGHQSYTHGWNHYCNAVPFKRMPVIVASTVEGCRAWEGEFDAEPQNDGDLSHIWDQLGEGQILKPNWAYLLSPDCIHESMIFEKPTQRQFIRMALPVNTPM